MEPPPSDPPLTISQNANNHHNYQNQRPITDYPTRRDNADNGVFIGFAGGVAMCYPMCVGVMGMHTSLNLRVTRC